MFGSKSNKQKAQKEISIETMKGNLNGEEGRPFLVKYDEKTENQNTAQSADSLVTENTLETNNRDSKKTVFKSPFNNTLPTSDIASKKGTFSTPEDLPTEVSPTTEGLVLSEDIKNANRAKNTINTPKKKELTFLHQAVDEQIKSKETIPDRQTGKTTIKEKKSIGTLVFTVTLVLSLAGIMYGGYYFYMNQNSNISKKQNNEQTEKINTKVNVVNNKQEQATKSSPDKTVPDLKETKSKIEILITSSATFNEDLYKFILDIKQRRNKVDLQKGILIDIETTNNKELSSKELLKILHMPEFFDQANLKEVCKLFVIEDADKIRVGVVFELSDTADEKIVKNTIIKKEKELMAKMSYLFVDGVKPIVPAEVKFAVNPTNMQARYANYTPGIDTSSVDWNILDLGKGKLIYFVTSRKSAKILTDYFMKIAIK